MKRSTTVIALIAFMTILSQDALCQRHIKFQIRGEYNFFSMSDLKEIQNSVVFDFRSSGIPAAVVESFPPYYGIQFRLNIPTFSDIPDLGIGVLFDCSSTGGRVHYMDYSGEVKFDQILKMYSFGGYIEKKNKITELLETNYGISAQFVIANLDFNFLTRIGNQSASELLEFSCNSAGFEPYAGITLNKYGFSLGFNAGYLITIPSQFKLSSERKLQTANNKPVNLQMNIFRIGITAGYVF